MARDPNRGRAARRGRPTGDETAPELLPPSVTGAIDEPIAHTPVCETGAPAGEVRPLVNSALYGSDAARQTGLHQSYEDHGFRYSEPVPEPEAHGSCRRTSESIPVTGRARSLMMMSCCAASTDPGLLGHPRPRPAATVEHVRIDVVGLDGHRGRVWGQPDSPPMASTAAPTSAVATGSLTVSRVPMPDTSRWLARSRSCSLGLGTSRAALPAFARRLSESSCAPSLRPMRSLPPTTARRYGSSFGMG